MSWLDDLKTRAEQSVANIGNNVGDYLGSLSIDSVIKTAPAPGGNQTAAQIAQGQFGRPVGGAGPSAPASPNSQSVSQVIGNPANMLPIIAAVGLGVFFLMKRR